MALRGNLKDFSLPDVFQLVQLSGKTGVLRIVGPDAEGSIWFRDGNVFFAQSNWRREQLGERLVAAQRITPAALARALDLRAAEPEGGRRLGEILVNEGYITQQVLESFVQEQIQDTIFDLMRWDEGDFDFEVLPEVVHEDIGLAVSVENIVMEGSRRLEEWQRIKKKVPSTDMVFKMATAPGEGTFEISLKPIEWALLLLIDGTRSVRELATATRSTDFEVARVIYGLFSAGLLEVPTDEEIERLRADRERREDKRAALEAKRAARDAEQQAEALDIEAKLAAEAARRAGDEPVAEAPEVEAPEAGEAPEAEEAPAVRPKAEREREPEEPEFLAMPGEAPSPEDMAVFEQMMASVLTGTEEAAPAAPVETESAADTGLVPGVDFIPEEGEEAEGGVYVSYAPDVEAEEQAPPAEELLPEEELPFGPISASDIADIPAPPVAEVPPLPEGFTPTGDFEVDLLALGLGELPEELLPPAASEPVEIPEVSETPEAAEVPGVGESFEAFEVPDEAVEEIQATDVVEIEVAPAAFIEPEETVAESSLSDEIPPIDSDLDTLLASLGEAAPASEGVISSGTDYGPESDTSGGVLSTDAFLAEFDSPGLANGMSEELTALTGGAGARNRPVATVNKLPEPGEGHVIHRDQMVDKALLEKIIEGIENL